MRVRELITELEKIDKEYPDTRIYIGITDDDHERLGIKAIDIPPFYDIKLPNKKEVKMLKKEGLPLYINLGTGFTETWPTGD
jgi:hypothetical protein